MRLILVICKRKVPPRIWEWELHLVRPNGSREVLGSHDPAQTCPSWEDALETGLRNLQATAEAL